MNHNLRIATKAIAGYTAHFFRYDATPDMSFDCSILCEVGQPFIPGFKRMIQDRKLDLVEVEIEEHPWVITVLKEEAMQGDHWFHCPICNAQYVSFLPFWDEQCKGCNYTYQPEHE